MKLACVQAPVLYGNPVQNAHHAIQKLRELKARGVDLVVFPEAFLTGYCVDSLEDARKIAIPRDHDALNKIEAACQELNLLCVVGFAESQDETLFNTAALFEPGQPPRYYSKTHLPELGLDRFVARGDTLKVFETRLGKIGILICYDLRVPEAARVLALQGAELIVLPTNWPERPGVSPAMLSNARAMENKIFFACTNRIGEENGFRFKGGSCIVDLSGATLKSAGEGEEILIADLDLSAAKIKRSVVIPGKFESDAFASRRPELYAGLTK